MVKSVQTQQPDDVVIAEAAAWIARLQGSGRTTAAEAAFKEWLSADAAHARAFARATDVWDVIPGAAQFNRHPMGAHPPATARRLLPWSLAACFALAIGALGIALYVLRTPTYITAVGQQQTITLDDGTRVSLNTDSKLAVDYTARERRLRLEKGEGLFEVARDSTRPFIVQAGREQVRALGTTFVVRRDAGAVAVTLIEGKVEIIRQAQPAQKISRETSLQKAVTLSPGERVTVRVDTGLALDHPKVEALTAWQRGEVMFDNASLLDATAEINRYGNQQVILAEPGLAELRVSGVFETRDPEEFAHAMAQLHHLNVRREGREILLER